MSAFKTIIQRATEDALSVSTSYLPPLAAAAASAVPVVAAAPSLASTSRRHHRAALSPSLSHGHDMLRRVVDPGAAAAKRAGPVLADAFAQVHQTLRRRESVHAHTEHMSLPQALAYDATSSISAITILSILGGFIFVFLTCIAISRILAITNRPSREAFPYQAASGKGMYQPSANMPSRLTATSGQSRIASASAGLLAGAAPMGGRDSTVGSVDTLPYGQAPHLDFAGRGVLQHTRGASSGLGFPGPPTAARRGPGAQGGQQHPPLGGGSGSGAPAPAPDGSGFQPGAVYTGASVAPRLRSPLHNGPPPASDGRRQSRYNRIGGGLNGGLGVHTAGAQQQQQQPLRDPHNRMSMADRRSRIQSVGAGVYRKSMYMDDPQAAGASGSTGIRRVESISRGNSLRYRDSTPGVLETPGSEVGVGAGRRLSARGPQSLYGANAGSRLVVGNGSAAVTSSGQSYPPNSSASPQHCPHGPPPSGRPKPDRRSIYGDRGTDAERGAFLSAQREGFGSGSSAGKYGPLQPRAGAGAGSAPQLAPIDTSSAPLSSNSIGLMGMRSSSAGSQQEFLSTPSPSAGSMFSHGYVVPNPTAPNYGAFAAQHNAALSQSTYNAAAPLSGTPAGAAGLRPGMPARQVSGASSSAGSGRASPIGGSGGADLFSSAPLPRNTSSAAASGAGGPGAYPYSGGPSGGGGPPIGFGAPPGAGAYGPGPGGFAPGRGIVASGRHLV
ncbi:hypothetical protein K437DRAFT_91039 [Tilletiaria anomala UBC 951]|uniref:Uncharacterized protein n=1 Tax=Tilletiaria anomala (strain ATCC 24038 / CBS 436.72 / UBC 951) TaxID=1037660 RepID=A0A066W597_TILAU|nr:uncharacterized protein K437DRAFT_91039 [Tilletiaria anomala UBC 951]KDN47723.1 hypothetical protein K437DRAFT_91039 [Tilletiaria anomala UBC 951]